MLSIQCFSFIMITKSSWENPCWENHFKFYVAAFRRWRKKVCPVNSRIIELQFSCIALFTLESVQIHDGEIKHGLQAERKIDCLQESNFPCQLLWKTGNICMGWVKYSPGQLTLWTIHLIFISKAFSKPVFIRFCKLKLHFLGVAFKQEVTLAMGT